MNRFETLMSVLTAPMQRFENAAIQLLTEKSIDVAVGAQLDVLGRIVGQGRAGAADDVYRRYIRARIAVNRSTGKHEEFVNIAKLVVNDPNLIVNIHTVWNATAIVELDGVAVSQSTADVCRDMLKAAAVAGVRIVLDFSLSIPGNTFRYDSGPGFDVGHYAGGEE